MMQSGGAADLAHWHAVLQKAGLTLERCVGDLNAFGTWLPNEAPSTTATLATEVARLGDAARSLAEALQSNRARFVEAQLRALGVDHSSRGLRLNIGSGADKIPGWIGIDLQGADLALNLRWGLPFADGAADLAYSSHCLEHQYLADALATLREIHRVLAPGGRVRLVVPDMEAYARAYVEDDRDFFAERRRTWYWVPQDLTPLMTVIGYAGAGTRSMDAGDYHRYGYDYATLEFLLRRVGFTSVERCLYMSGSCQELLLDDHSRVAGAHHRGRPYSLFVEATKPSDRNGPTA